MDDDDEKEKEKRKRKRRVRDVTREKNDFYVYDESIKRER